MDQWAQWDVVLLIKYDCGSQANSKQCLYVWRPEVPCCHWADSESWIGIGRVGIWIWVCGREYKLIQNQCDDQIRSTVMHKRKQRPLDLCP